MRTVLSVDAHQQLLCHRALQAAREKGPLAATERAVLAALALGSEAHDLAQHFFSFAVDGSHGFPHNGGEDVVRSLELLVVLLVLGVLRVGFTRLSFVRLFLVKGQVMPRRWRELGRSASWGWSRRRGVGRAEIPRCPSSPSQGKACLGWLSCPPCRAERCGG